MMILDFVEQLKDRGVVLSVAEGNLKMTAPRNVLTEEIKKSISARKQEILDYLELSRQFIDGTIHPVGQEESYPLSYSQERFWALEQITESLSSYVTSRGFVLVGTLIEDKLQEAVDRVVERHEGLRVYFREIDGEVRQLIRPATERLLAIKYEDATGSEASEDFIRKVVAEEESIGFDLAQGPLLRIRILRLPANKYFFLYSLHHIIFDAQSHEIFVGEIMHIYKASVEGRSATLPPLMFQYKDYAVWERNCIESGFLRNQERYWLNTLSGELPVLDLSLGAKDRPLIMGREGKRKKMLFGKKVTERIRTLVQGNHVTVFSFLMATLQGTFNRITGADDTIIGVPVTGRKAPGLENQIGLYLNTVAIRTRFKSDMTFLSLLQMQQQLIFDALSNADYPISILVKKLGLERDASRSPLFDVVLSLEAVSDKTLTQVKLPEGISTERAPDVDDNSSKVDVSFLAMESRDDIEVDVNYNSSILDDNEVDRIFQYWYRFVTTVLDDPSMRISDVDCLDVRERYLLLNDFNNTTGVYPNEKTLVQMFRDIVAQFPDRFAVRHNGSRLTYDELNALSNRLAHHLRKKLEIHPEDRIAIMLDNSDKMVIGILGILKTGAAYVPIDSHWPRRRKEYILEKSQAHLLLIDNTSADVPQSVECLNLSDPLDESDEDLSVESRPDHLACIIYTSGPHGDPIGVMLEARAIANRIDWMYNKFNFTKSDVQLQYMPVSYDGSVWELFLSLCYGIQLVTGGPSQQPDLSLNRDITTVHFTPSAYEVFLESVGKQQTQYPVSLRHIFLSGDVCSSALVARHYELSDIPLYNLYGPTETTMDATCYETSPKDRLVLVGKPILNTSIFILSGDLSLLPPGAVGDIYIGGLGLSRGYIGDAELTSKRFVPNPFRRGEKLFHTSDRGRWLSDGNIQFLGRQAHTIKAGGTRIELKEIENVLLQCEGILDAVISVDRSVKEQTLTAYVVAVNRIDHEALQSALALRLPLVMVPSKFVQLENIPRFERGGPDWKKCLRGATSIHDKESTAITIKLLKIIRELFGKDDIGDDENFFSIGGDSMIAIRFVNLIRNRLGKEIKVTDVIQHPTVRELSLILSQKDLGTPVQNGDKRIRELIASIKNDETERLKLPLLFEDMYPMSDIEQGMIFHNLLGQRSAVYHDQFIYRVVDPTFSFDLFTKAFSLLVEKHSILRTSFHMETTPPVQVVHYPDSFLPDILLEDLTSFDAQSQHTYISDFMTDDRNNPFVPSKPGLWRLRVFTVGHNEYEVLWIFHHAIMDGWSNASLLTELSNVYFKLKDDINFRPTRLKASYRDFVAEQLMISQESAASYWRDHLSGFERTPLPFNRKGDGKGKIARHRFPIDATVYNNAIDVAKRLGLSPKDVFLSAFLYLVRFVTNCNDLTVGVVINGRPALEDGDKIIGCFLNTIPLRVQLNGTFTGNHLMNVVSKRFLEARAYDKLSLHQVSQAVGLSHNSGNQIFDILFDYLDFYIFRDVHSDTRIVESPVDVYENTNTSFDFNVVHNGIGVDISISYTTSLYDKEEITRIGDYYVRILREVSLESHVLSARNIMGEREFRLLTKDFNNTAKSYPSDRSIAQLFEDQVRKTPDAIAVRDDDGVLSYVQFDDRSSRLASAIAAIAEPGTIVAIMMPRSLSLATTIIAVWKASAACVMISSEEPVERARQLISLAGASVIITEDSVAVEDRLEGISYLGFRDAIKGDQKIKLPVPASGSDLAYIIFTSGSTGVPKGIRIGHSGKINHLLALIDLLRIDASTVVAQTAQTSFDIFMWQMVAALLAGAQVRIYSRELQMNPSAFISAINNDRVTILQHVPSYFEALFETLESSREHLPYLKYLFTTGEEISVSLARRWFDINQSAALVNGYGPAEASDDVTIYLTRDCASLDRVPIGKPIQNALVSIIDRSEDLCPIGVEGEIAIAGECLAHGYLNEELTAASFKNIGPGHERHYLTGDLGKWRPDGNLVFLGRLGDQLKINGNRIEPGEVERAIEDFPGIKMVAVLGKQRGNTLISLMACFTSTAEVNIQSLRNFLKTKLPAHMIPDGYVRLERMPLTPNGKIDRNALVSVGTGQLQQTLMVPARNDDEKYIYSIWTKLLGTDGFGVTDNFFEVGGNSLSCVQLVSRINNSRRAVIRIGDIYENSTIEKQALLLGNIADPIPDIQRVELSDDYILSSAQQRFWYLAQHTENSLSYIDTMSFAITGDLDIAAFEKAHLFLIQRHESLRTVFHEINGEVRQVVLPFDRVNFRLNLVDFSMFDDPERRLGEMYDKEQLTAFDLEVGPILRAHLVKLGESRYAYIYSSHHIISDGWSLEIISSEIAIAYNSIRGGNAPHLPPLKIQYKDYAAWQRRQLDIGFEKERNYWLSQLTHPLPLLDMPLDKARGPVSRHHGGSVEGILPRHLSVALKSLAISQGGTLFTGLLACLNGLLYRYTGQDDIIVGTPVAGRIHEDLENQVGLFLNTLALRSRFDPKASFTQLLHTVNIVVAGGSSHQQYPFDLLVDDLQIDRDVSRSPLFDVMIILQNQNTVRLDGGSNRFEGIQTSVIPDLRRRTSKFDLVFSFMEVPEGLLLEIFYKDDLYNRDTIERLFKHFSSFVGNVLNDSSQTLNAIDYIDHEEKSRLLKSFNNTRLEIPDSTIHGLFEERVLAQPDRPALIFNGVQLSYRELNQRSDELAAHIVSAFKIRPDDTVAIICKRSEQMIIAMFAVLKAGAAYVPINLAYPRSRVEAILTDAEVKLVLTDNSGDSLFNREQFTCVSLPFSSSQNKSAVVQPVGGTPANLAYVIYTSGSTGGAKGVMVEHRTAVNTLWWRILYYRMDSKVVNLQIPNFAFDSSVADIFSVLLSGGTLVMIEESTILDPQSLAKTINANSVTHMLIVPSLYRAFLNVYNEPLPSLSCVTVAGEEVHESLVDLHYSKLSSVQLVNEYGPTECSVCATAAVLQPGKPVRIGKPISNVNIYLLDRAMRLVPVNVPGEIYIGGAGVSRGYVSHPDGAVQPFMDDPFVEGGRMYKTGDLAKWDNDGQLVFLGRCDHEAKIRGNRVVLLEVENALLSHPAVLAGVVSVIESDDGTFTKQLVAYVILNESSASDIRDHMRQHVPEYMVPSFFVRLTALPLTANGKIDRRALIPPSPDNIIKHSNFREASNEMEAMLMELWREVLRRDSISADDNYFALGGDSIRSIQISARLHERGFQLDVPDILRYPVLKDAAARIVRVERYASQEAITGTSLPGPIQRWFLEGRNKFKDHYVQSVLLQSSARLHETSVGRIFNKILFHHDALRMRFYRTENGWMQENRGDIQLSIVRHFDLMNKSQEEALKEMVRLCTEMQSPFNLSDELLIRVVHFKLPDADRLLIAVHHLVSDAVSWRILMEDVATLCQQAASGNELTLPPKTDSYLIWTQGLAGYSRTPSMLSEFETWKTVDSKVYDRLPIDFDVPECLVSDTVEQQVQFDDNTLARLAALNAGLGIETHEGLLCCLAIALQETFPDKNLPLDIEGHGRENILAGVNFSRTIGWFTNVYPVHFDTDRSADIISRFQQMVLTVRAIPNRGIGFGILKYMTDPSDIGRYQFQLQPEISFNYLGHFSSGSGGDQNGQRTLKVSGEMLIREFDEREIRAYPIEVKCLVVDGMLGMTISYGRTQFRSETIARLRDNYQRVLDEILNAASDNDATDRSLLGNSSITMEELKELWSK